MIVLFTDYGLTGPYLGQVRALLSQEAPGQTVINLMADVPRQNPQAGAYLLASLTPEFPEGTIFFCVVDPGVGSFKDEPLILKTGGCWFVGPNNGLFDIVTRQGDATECWKIHWRPERLSASFHGRDLYAPLCAMIASGLDIPGEAVAWQDRHNWPDDLAAIIYIDHFGNCMTGMRATAVDPSRVVCVNDQRIAHAGTFANVDTGEAFWYENSNGLVEIAVNQGHAANDFGLTVGSAIEFT